MFGRLWFSAQNPLFIAGIKAKNIKIAPYICYEIAYSQSEQAEAATEFYKWSNSKYHYFDRFKEKKE